MEKSNKRVSKQDIEKFKEVFEVLYEGEGSTYSEIVKYIFEKVLYSKICNVIDNVDLESILDKNVLFDLAQIIRIYILKYDKKGKLIYDFLYNFSEESFEDDLLKLEKYWVRLGYPTNKEINEYISRFAKLNLVSIPKKYADKVINIVYLHNKQVDAKLKSEGTSSTEFNKNYKLILHMPVIIEAYKEYKQSGDFNSACDLIDSNPVTFYNDVHFIKTYIDDQYRSFAIKLANYNYNKYLINEYKIYLISYKYVDANDLCEHIYSNYKGTAKSLCKRLEKYIIVSPFVTDNQKKYIRWVEKKYTEFYAAKKVQEKEKRELEKKMVALDSAVEHIEQYICSDDVSTYDENKLRRDLIILKECKHPLYDTYAAAVEKRREEEVNNTVIIAKKIVNLIENGIEENGYVRQFDIIDYFLITSLSFQKLLELVRDNISYRDHYILVKFMENKEAEFEWNENYINRMYTWDHIVGVEFDENGNIVDGRLLSLNEKKAIIDSLRQLSVPINQITYNAAVNRLLANPANILTNKSKSKKKVK